MSDRESITRSRSRYKRVPHGGDERRPTPTTTASTTTNHASGSSDTTTLSPPIPKPVQPDHHQAANARSPTRKRPSGVRSTSQTRVGSTDDTLRTPSRHGSSSGRPNTAVPSGQNIVRIGSNARSQRAPQVFSATTLSKDAHAIGGQTASVQSPRLAARARKNAPVPDPLNGPPSSKDIRATKSLSYLPRTSRGHGDEENDKGVGCFGFFRRKRADVAPPRAASPSPAMRQITYLEPQTIRPGGGGAVPGTDAPVSAVNAGDRMVLLASGGSPSLFPVTPSTTPTDLIQSAALCMSGERVDARSAVLLEPFGSVGVQRPLRQYERVREVLNSWDHDRENSLLLVDTGKNAMSPEADLSLAGAPCAAPDDQSWTLMYSRKPGKWDKRIITLRATGQVTIQKIGAKSTALDQIHLCHLSDFDIYTPTPHKARQKIRAPKRFCFAVKSQQKTSMFESMQNFVHFFCTGDQSIGDSFYAAVHGWRSWYLVNVLEEGRSNAVTSTSTSKDGEEVDDVPTLGQGIGQSQHRPGEAVTSHFELGSFKPLLDLDRFRDDRPASAGNPSLQTTGHLTTFTKSAKQFDTTLSPERRASRSRREHPPPAILNNVDVLAPGGRLADDEPLANLTRRASTASSRRKSLRDSPRISSDGFAANTLLGRTYSQRQREQKSRENDPFSADTILLSSVQPDPTAMPLRRNSSARKRERPVPQQSGDKNSGNNHSGGQPKRSPSRRDPATMTSALPRPLVDLTPTCYQPPQHANKGRGYRPSSDVTGPLIESATSPDYPMGIPASVDWRAGAGGSTNLALITGSGGGGGDEFAMPGSLLERAASRSKRQT